MLGDHSYPLYIGISVLQQLKNTLLSSGFNECILLFSDLPDIVMETCVIESQKMYLNTPKSITYRKYVLHDTEPGKYVFLITFTVVTRRLTVLIFCFRI